MATNREIARSGLQIKKSEPKRNEAKKAPESLGAPALYVWASTKKTNIDVTELHRLMIASVALRIESLGGGTFRATVAKNRHGLIGQMVEFKLNGVYDLKP